MSRLSPETRALIAAADETDRLSEEQRQELREALVRRLGLGAGAGAALAVAGKTATGASSGAATTVAAGGAANGIAVASGLTLTAKIAGALIVAGTVAVSVGVLSADPRGSAVPVVSQAASIRAPDLGSAAPAPVGAASTSAEPPAVVPADLPTVSPQAPVAALRLATPHRPPPVPSASITPPSSPAETSPPIVAAPVETTLPIETDLLRRARELLVSGDAGGALAVLREHAKTFPHGVLAEERDAERVTALCASGQIAQAREEAAAFVAAHPGSTSASRVRRTCAAR